MSKGKQRWRYSTAAQIFDRLQDIQQGEQWRVDFSEIRPKFRKLLSRMPDVKNHPKGDHFVKPKHQCNGPGCKDTPEMFTKADMTDFGLWLLSDERHDLIQRIRPSVDPETVEQIASDVHKADFEKWEEKRIKSECGSGDKTAREKWLDTKDVMKAAERMIKEIADVEIDEEAEISSFIIDDTDLEMRTDDDGYIRLTVTADARGVDREKLEELENKATHHKVKLTIDGISDGDTSSHFGDAFDWAIHRQLEKDDNPGGILGIEQKRRDREERSAIKTINHRTYGLYKALRLYLEKLREKERAKDYKDEYNVERADVAIAAQALRDEYREWKAEMERYNDLANQRQYFGLMGTLERQANYVRDLEIGCWVADPNFEIKKCLNDIAPPFQGVIMTGGVKAEPKPADGLPNKFTFLDESGEISEQYAELFANWKPSLFVYDGFDWMGPDETGKYAAHYVDVSRDNFTFNINELHKAIKADPEFNLKKYVKDRSRENAFNSMREIISYIENHEPDILDDLNGLTFHFIGNKYDEEE